ncbi:hypothetical protein ACFY2R_24865 [Micromonospora olivasterospora]|uniref:Uncharacterized protein n=1 Tax=Micromonospora olivasterospora TaxID=1880 RepID=A0A562I599_MICOL|nr:hypothetical protein [Micromonospora olivasterospora]TWH65874.1 hypothetical protein JD77_00814 [Micromonospora olivasterospora]
MVRLVKRLILAAAGVLLAAVLTPALAEPAHAAGAGTAQGGAGRAGGGPAQAAPKPKAPPAGVDITGHQLAEPLRLRAATHPAEVAAVIDQVNWLSRTGAAAGPKPDDLGPKYTVVVLAGDVPTQTYDLYPLALGGPRVYRPAKQPDPAHRAKAGWFLGRLNMSETLRTAGVPLERQLDTVSGGGGVGGGERVLPDESLKPGKDLGEAMGELQRLLLLNVGVLVAITVGLAGIALLIRRRTR